jgi:hypothetical protein
LSVFGQASPDNDAIRQTRDHSKRQVELIEDLGKSSKDLEKLTKVLILFTIAIIGTSLPNAVTTMMGLVNTNPYAFAGIFFVITILFMIGVFAIYPQDLYTIIDKVLGRKEATPEPKPETKEVHAGAAIEAKAHVEAYNPPQFTFEDYRAAISLLIISIVFLWLSYQLKSVFPSNISNVMNNLILSMWGLLVGSIAVIGIILYRTFKG